MRKRVLQGGSPVGAAEATNCVGYFATSHHSGCRCDCGHVALSTGEGVDHLVVFNFICRFVKIMHAEDHRGTGDDFLSYVDKKSGQILKLDNFIKG